MAGQPMLLLLLVFALAAANVAGACRKAQLPRDCEALCSFNQSGQVTSCELRAAVLLPSDAKYEISLFKVLPVLNLAEYQARSKGLLPSWLKLRFLPQDDGCDATYAQLGAIDSYSRCVHVFFGPACDYCVASVGRIAKFLNAPLITTGGFTFDFTDKKKVCEDEYFMTIRIGTLAFRDIALFFIDLMSRHHWEKVNLLYDTNAQTQVAGRHSCQLMMKTMVEYLKKKHLSFGSFDTSVSKFENYNDVLKEHVGNVYGVYCPTKLDYYY